MVKLLPAHDWPSIYEVTGFSFFHILGMTFHVLGVEWGLMNALSFQDLNSGFLQPVLLHRYLFYILRTPTARCNARQQGLTNTALVFAGFTSPEGLSLSTLDILD